ncbi:high affinity copper uptake protein 1 [Galendromus occidentalis]|uniref:Copper transport protein n=1 Tax=Galendromus occidentalis TaxID=34638 RepID=A0AAJ7L7I1_9ACAR|nr:high affinity copper uptake protein 1 [Galendromus occidentalis]XP_018496457.1 high affinity copper uptake protein 1 [Galendromus occidentalis]
MDHGSHPHMDQTSAGHVMGVPHAIHIPMMQMTFNFSDDVTLLFDWWHPKDVLGMLVSCAVIFAMAATLEMLRAFRDAMYVRSRQTGSSSSLISSSSMSWTSAIFAPCHITQTILYFIQVVAGYMLMLLFMTFNGYVCIAIVLGATVGHFAFGWRKSMLFEVTADHCG